MDDRFEEGVQIPDFWNYQITNYGRVFNHEGLEMTRSPTQYGDLTVGLVSRGVQHRRSIKVLVARAFVPGETPLFDSPMLLDGDRENLHAVNIVWRPRWMVWNYTNRFEKWKENSDYRLVPVMNVETGQWYDSILEAAIATGSMCEDIFESTINGRPVFPGGERYERG